MIDRRDLVIGAACLAAAGAAWELTPRRRLSLLGADKLEAIVPTAFGGWTSSNIDDWVAPKEEGSLASRIYGQTVGRIYRQAGTAAEVMMLMAYGGKETADLQLHRPEICYPAFGYRLSGNRPLAIPLAAGVSLPSRRLIAEAPGRRENIIYWSRLGEYIPVEAHEQRNDRLKTAMAGYVADGLLARFSAVDAHSDEALALVAGFIPALIRAVRRDKRAALIGTPRARAMAAAEV